MKAFIIAALTADGFIAKNSTHTPLGWTSKEDKQFFAGRTKEAGVVVMGKNTYETILRPFPGRHTIVYAAQPYEGIEVTQKSPQELLEDLEKRGFKELAVCGGSTVYTMFMEAGCVDTIYLTVEPHLFGTGMTLFNKELEAKLELISVGKLGENTVLSEYKVLN
ncbi:MAG: dihydrofolate reductase [Parcubacteria group bacterium]|nr:dihydrofolate reductase [Parcubacteria group bacterium]